MRSLTTHWSRPGQPGVSFGAILALAGRAAQLEAVGPLDIPDLIRSNLGLAETGSKSKAGGGQRLPLFL